MDESRVIGIRGGLPWHIPEDTRRFAALTTGHTLLMGATTYDSLPSGSRPLPQRKSIVLSRSRTLIPGAEVWPSFESYLEHCRDGVERPLSDTLWVAGGEQVYRTTLQYWDEIYLSLIPGRHEGDTYFPEFEANFELVSTEQGKSCAFLLYRRL